MRQEDTAAGPSRAANPGQREGNEQLYKLYRSLWRDYFLSLLLRKRMMHQTLAFRRAVTAGQVLPLATLIAALGVSIRSLNPLTIPVEHRAVLRWMEANTDAFTVTRWHPVQADPGGAGARVQVEYR
jgi:hypothetical protein